MGPVTAERGRMSGLALSEGKRVAIHCRAGVGRSALLAAALLVAGGVEVEAAFRRVADARGCPVPDTPEQRAWVARLAPELVAAGTSRAE